MRRGERLTESVYLYLLHAPVVGGYPKAKARRATHTLGHWGDSDLAIVKHLRMTMKSTSFKTILHLVQVIIPMPFTITRAFGGSGSNEWSMPQMSDAWLPSSFITLAGWLAG